jgi:zinc protease
MVMDHVLGTGPGFTNRISRRLRDELGLAYSVNASIHASAGVLPGTFMAYIGTSPENLATSVAGFQREIRRIQEELVPEEELELAKSYLTGSFVLGFERAARRVLTIISAQRNELPDDHLEELVRALGRVTAADVRRVACAHLFPERSCLAVAGPVKEKQVAALAAASILRRAGSRPRSGSSGGSASARRERGPAQGRRLRWSSGGARWPMRDS